MRLSERRALSQVLPWLNRYRDKPAYTLVGFDIHYSKLTSDQYVIVNNFLEKRDSNTIALSTIGIESNGTTQVHFFSVAKTPHEVWKEHTYAANIVLPLVKTAYPTTDLGLAADAVDRHRIDLQNHHHVDLPKYRFEPMEAHGNSDKMNKFFDGALVIREIEVANRDRNFINAIHGKP